MRNWLAHNGTMLVLLTVGAIVLGLCIAAWVNRQKIFSWLLGRPWGRKLIERFLATKAYFDDPRLGTWRKRRVRTWVLIGATLVAVFIGLQMVHFGSGGGFWFGLLIVPVLLLVIIIISAFFRKPKKRRADKATPAPQARASAHTASHDDDHDSHGHAPEKASWGVFRWSLAAIAATAAVIVVTLGINWMNRNESLAPPPVYNPVASAEETARLRAAASTPVEAVAPAADPCSANVPVIYPFVAGTTRVKVSGARMGYRMCVRELEHLQVVCRSDDGDDADGWAMGVCDHDTRWFGYTSAETSTDGRTQPVHAGYFYLDRNGTEAEAAVAAIVPPTPDPS